MGTDMNTCVSARVKGDLGVTLEAHISRRETIIPSGQRTIVVGEVVMADTIDCMYYACIGLV